MKINIKNISLKMLFTALLVCTGLTLSGCSRTEKALTGAVIGAGVGAGIGAAAGGGTGAAIGAGVGAVGGAAIGHSMGDDD